METQEKSMAQQLHDSYRIQDKVEYIIEEAFQKYEPEIYKGLDFHIGSDDYDNSIEIYFDIPLPYPYEPCKEIRQVIYDLGFSSIYWNFLKDTMDVIKFEKEWKDSPDEIRDWEPRHNKHFHWIPNKYGYVDDRFNEELWIKNYNFQNK